MALEITAETTVARIAVELPRLIPELERMGIDYCCGGGRTLAQAALSAGRDVEEVTAALKAAGAGEPSAPARDWSTATMTELADHVERTHHAYTRAALERLGSLIDRCVAAHGDGEPRLVELQLAFYGLRDDLHDHFVREERVLFPWLRRLERRSEITGGPPWSVKRPIDCMVHDHDEVGVTFARIHTLTDGLTPPANACATWRECYRVLGELERDLHVHVHLENNVLFPAGVEAERRLGRGRRPG